MDDPLLVRRFESLGDLFRDGQRLMIGNPRGPTPTRRPAPLPLGLERRLSPSVEECRSMSCDRSSPSTSSITSAVRFAVFSSP